MIPAYLLVHTVTVKPYEGSGAYGDVYGASFTLPCYVEQERRVVRGPEGDDVISQTQVYADLTTTPIKPGSKVTLSDGTTTTVITVARHDDGGLTGLAHQQIDCE